MYAINLTLLHLSGSLIMSMVMSIPPFDWDVKKILAHTSHSLAFSPGMWRVILSDVGWSCVWGLFVHKKLGKKVDIIID